MRYTLRALVLLALCVSATAAYAQTALEEASAYPTVGAPGGRFSFFAAGYQSRERVAVWINAPDGRVLTEGIENLDRATRDGRVSWSWTAPEGAPTGVWQMVAHGLSSGLERVISFEIQAVTPPLAGGNIQPRSGIPGTLFTFYASGFLLDEDVRVWANPPSGEPVVIELAQRRLFNGRLDGSWSSPPNAQRGAWQIVVHGVDSGIEHVLDFEIR